VVNVFRRLRLKPDNPVSYPSSWVSPWIHRMTLFVDLFGDFLALQLAPVSPRRYQEVTRNIEWAEPPTTSVSAPGVLPSTPLLVRTLSGGPSVRGRHPWGGRAVRRLPRGEARTTRPWGRGRASAGGTSPHRVPTPWRPPTSVRRGRLGRPMARR